MILWEKLLVCLIWRFNNFDDSPKYFMDLSSIYIFRRYILILLFIFKGSDIIRFLFSTYWIINLIVLYIPDFHVVKWGKDP